MVVRVPSCLATISFGDLVQIHKSQSLAAATFPVQCFKLFKTFHCVVNFNFKKCRVINLVAMAVQNIWSRQHLWKSVAVFCGYVAIGVFQAVSVKRMGYGMRNYPLFVLVTLSAAFVPALFLPSWYVQWRGGGYRSRHIHAQWSLGLSARSAS